MVHGTEYGGLSEVDRSGIDQEWNYVKSKRIASLHCFHKVGQSQGVVEQLNR
jgi:hypothetical protein